eukprot:4171662-Pleurochrysis_carterae.AAC.3
MQPGRRAFPNACVQARHGRRQERASAPRGMSPELGCGRNLPAKNQRWRAEPMTSFRKGPRRRARHRGSPCSQGATAAMQHSPIGRVGH